MYQNFHKHLHHILHFKDRKKMNLKNIYNKNKKIQDLRNYIYNLIYHKYHRSQLDNKIQK